MEHFIYLKLRIVGLMAKNKMKLYKYYRIYNHNMEFFI